VWGEEQDPAGLAGHVWFGHCVSFVLGFDTLMGS
jgi:hypothetical protein